MFGLGLGFASGQGGIIRPFPGSLHQWSAGVTKSYPGTGTSWLDLVGGLHLAPGAAPNFQGSTGQKGSNFDFVPTDYLVSDVLSASNSPVLYNMHKGTQSFTLVYVGRNSPADASTRMILTTGLSSQARMSLYRVSNTDNILFAARSTSATITKTTATNTQNNNASYNQPWNIHIYSYDAATGTMRYAMNSATPASISAYWNSTTTNNLNAAARFCVGTTYDGTGANATDGQIRHIMITDQAYTDFTDIIEYFTALDFPAVSQDDTINYAQGFNYGVYGSAKTVKEHPVILVGDSLMDYMRANFSGAGMVALNNGLKPYGLHAVDVGVGGSSLTKAANATNHWWDETVPGKGTLFTKHLDIYPKASYVWLRIGTNDIPYAISQANYETYLNALVAQIAAFSQFQKVIIDPWHRSASLNDANSQAVNAAILNVIASNANVKRGITLYDIPYDGTHFTQAGNELAAARMIQRYLAITGQRSEVGTLGPKMASASRSGTTITVNVTLDDDTDISVGADADDIIKVFDNTTPMTINSIARASATTFTVTVSSTPSGTVTVWCGYGNMNALTGVNTGPVIRGNGALNLPLQKGYVTVT